MRINKIIAFYLKSKIATRRLIRAISSSDVNGIAQVIDSFHHGYLNIHYRNSRGNTLMHLAAIYAEFNYISKARFKLIVGQLNRLGLHFGALNNDNKRADEVITKEYLKMAIYEGANAGLAERVSKIEMAYGSGANFYSDQSRIYPGVRLTTDLSLFYGSKQPLKICEIPDRDPILDKIDGGALSLHQRLSCFIWYQKQLQQDTSINNYVTLNIGFVVSQKPHASTSRIERRRQFVSIPIRDPRFAVVWSQGNRDAVHSELLLYQYLSNPSHIDFIITNLQRIYKIYPGFKIYAMVIDLHTLNNMCSKTCTPATFENQLGGSFIQLIEKRLAELHYVLPSLKTPCPDLFTPQHKRLHIVTRISHSKIFDSDETRPFSSKQSEEIPVFTRTEEEKAEKDIKKFGNAVVLKDTRSENYASFWAKKNQAHSDTPTRKVVFTNQTAFLNYFKDANRYRLQDSVEHVTEEPIITMQI